MRWPRESRRFCARVALLSVAACSLSSSDPDERVGRTSEPIIGGANSTAAQNFVVLIVHPVAGSSTQLYECSGTLVAPNLVLTARHCVSSTADEPFTCDSDGNGSSGGAIGADFEPSTLWIFAGIDAPSDPTGADATAVGAQLFHDGATNLCNHDVALIGLDRSIPSTQANIATLGLYATPAAGELFTAVGWGLTSSNQVPTVRQQRANVPILHPGPYKSTDGEDVAPNEFDVGEVICEGDSGSPALDETNAVIGVASRGGNDLTPLANDIAASCEGAQTLNLYSRTAAFSDVILQAFQAVGQTPIVEGRSAFGFACEKSSDCSSDLCVGSGSAAYCSQACSASTPCPTGYLCNSDSGQPECEEGPEAVRGCAVSPGAPRRGAGVGLLAAAMALFGVRRRRAAPPASSPALRDEPARRVRRARARRGASWFRPGTPPARERASRSPPRS